MSERRLVGHFEVWGGGAFVLLYEQETQFGDFQVWYLMGDGRVIKLG